MAKRSPPRWPAILLGLFAILATLSILQGWADIVLPIMQGEEPFGFLFEMTERYGTGFFVGYIFIHNLGLACLVPGYGFLAAYFEKRAMNRYLVGILLTGSVVASLLVAAELILTAPGQFHLPTALALLVGESCGVLALAVAAARELKGFVPTRTYEWSLVHPFRNLRVPLGYSVVLLLILSLWEGFAVFGA